MKYPTDIHYIENESLLNTFFKLLQMNCDVNGISAYDLISISELNIEKK